MSRRTAEARRDPRIALIEGAGFVECDPGVSSEDEFRAEVIEVSVAGLTIEFVAGPQPSRGTSLPRARVSIGDCVVRGELVVQRDEGLPGRRSRLGCLFYPSSRLDEEKWSAVLAGLRAGRGDWPAHRGCWSIHVDEDSLR